MDQRLALLAGLLRQEVSQSQGRGMAPLKAYPAGKGPLEPNLSGPFSMSRLTRSSRNRSVGMPPALMNLAKLDYTVVACGGASIH